MKCSLVILFMAAALVISSCSESSTSNDNADVKLVANMLEENVSVFQSIKGSGNRTQDSETADSLRILKIRLLVSNIKLFSKFSDNNESNGQVVKTGPALITADTSGYLITFAQGAVKEGNYEKIKLEFHRFPTSELANYANDSVFADFATPERYSCIIDGIRYAAGKAEAFTYNATTTANLSLKFDPAVEMDKDNINILLTELSPDLVFTDKGSLLDPADPGNANKIDNNIQYIIKSVRKLVD